MKRSQFSFGALGLVGSLLLAACASAPGGAPAAAPAPVAKVKNLALGKSISSNNHIFDFVAQSAVDGEALSYFEGAANSYPNVITIDLGDRSSVQSQVLKLNPKRIWQARTQTLEVLVSDDGTTFTTAIPAAEYAFDPEENGNSVTLPWVGTTRYLRLVVTANTEATGGQIAEWEVLGQ